MKTQQLIYGFLSLALIFSLTACGGSSAEKEAAEKEDSDVSVSVTTDEGEDVKININTKDLEKGMADLQENLNKMTDGKSVEVVDFRKLKALLPSEVAGMEMTDSEGQKTGVVGFKTSMAKGTYQEGNKKIEITLLDTGGFSGALMGMAAWSQIEVDKESKDGYERTTMIDGYKAFEEYNNNSQHGQISIMVGDRYLLTINGNNISEKELKSALDAIDLDDLKDLS